MVTGLVGLGEVERVVGSLEGLIRSRVPGVHVVRVVLVVMGISGGKVGRLYCGIPCCRALSG